MSFKSWYEGASEKQLQKERDEQLQQPMSGFAQFVESANESVALENQISIAAQSNPDQAAKAQQLGQQFGVPTDIAERQVDVLETKQKAEEIDVIALEKQAEVLTQLLWDPDFAKIAHDDTAVLAALEQKLKELPSDGPTVAEGPSMYANEATWSDHLVDFAKSLPLVGDYLKRAERANLDEAGSQLVIQEMAEEQGITENELREQIGFATSLTDGNSIDLVMLGKVLGHGYKDTGTHYLAASAAQAAQGNDAQSILGDNWMNDLIHRAETQNQAFKEQYSSVINEKSGILGMTYGELYDVFESLGFSGVSMVSGVAGFAAGAPAAPATGGAAPVMSGMAASGAAAYRMDTNMFLREIITAAQIESYFSTGKLIPNEQLIPMLEELDPYVVEHGIFEAVPEAISNVGAIKAISAPVKSGIGKIFGEHVLTRFLTKSATVLGSELATETVTQMGQHNAAVKATETGHVTLTDESPRKWTSLEDWSESFQEVAPQTVAMVALMGPFTYGGGKIAGAYEASRFKKAVRDTVKENKLNVIPDTQLDRAIEMAEEMGMEEVQVLQAESHRRQTIMMRAVGSMMNPGVVGVDVNGQPVQEVVPVSQKEIELQRQGEQAIKNATILQEVAETVGNSKLMQRMPSAVAKLVQNIADAGMINEAEIEAAALMTYLQDNDLTPDDESIQALFQGMPAEAVEDAIASGASIKIPLDVLVTSVAGSEHLEALLPKIRMGENAMTLEEAEGWQQQNPGAAKSLEASVQSLADQVSANETSVGIFDNVKQQLIDTGMDADVADTNANLWGAFVESMSERTGQAPDQIMAGFTPTIRRVMPDGTAPADVDVDTLASMVKGETPAPEGQEAAVKAVSSFLSKDMGLDLKSAEIADVAAALRNSMGQDQGTTLKQNDNLEITEEFNAWAGPGFEVVEAEDINDLDFSEEKPYILKMFHGTTRSIETFEADKYGNIGGHFGKVNYFSSSEHDVDRNYAGGGVDLEGKIEKRAQEIGQEMDSYGEDPQYLVEEYGISYEEAHAIEEGEYSVLEEVAERLAREELDGGEHHIIPVYVKVQNPFILGDGSTNLIELFDDAELREEAIEDVVSSYGISREDYDENPDEYEDQFDEFYWDLLARADNPVIDAVRDVAYRYDVDLSELMDVIGEFTTEGEISHQALEDMMRVSSPLAYAENQEGELIQAQAISEVIQALGFDAIILKNADQRFTGMDLEPGTTHVHIFDDNRSAIKAQQNTGAFDSRDDRIYYQGGEMKWQIAAEYRVTSGQPVEGKPIVTKALSPVNLVKNSTAMDSLAKKYPDPLKSTRSWNAFERTMLSDNDIPAPPFEMIRLANDMDAWADRFGQLSEQQIAAASEGFEVVEGFKQAYEAGAVKPAVTGKLMLWGMLSRMLSAAPHESAFLDAVNGFAHGEDLAGVEGPDLMHFIESALDHEWTQEDVDAYLEWSGSVIATGSPGKQGTSNLNDFGGIFLKKMSQRKADGRSALEHLHDMIADHSIPSSEVRRQFYTLAGDVGIKNKVLSFVMLVSGRDDVVVLDRIQINTFWDAGRYGKLIYDDVATLFEGAQGLARYEALERSLAARMEELYTRVGRPEHASVGRYHWESWVLNSGQVVAHPTLQSLVDYVNGHEGAFKDIGAPEGRYHSFSYGAVYARDNENKPYMMYTDSQGNLYRFTTEEFKAFMAHIKKPGTGVVPRGFKVSEYREAGYPWYEAEGVNRDQLDQSIQEYGTRTGGSGDQQTVPQTGDHHADGSGQSATQGRGSEGTGEVSGSSDQESSPVTYYQDYGHYYSQAERALGSIQAKKGSIEQWISWLKKAGTKAEELHWIGLETIIEPGTILTKDEITRVIQENQLRIVEHESMSEWQRNIKFIQLAKEDPELRDEVVSRWLRSNRHSTIKNRYMTAHPEITDLEYWILLKGWDEVDLYHASGFTKDMIINQAVMGGREHIADLIRDYVPDVMINKHEHYVLSGETMSYGEFLITLPDVPGKFVEKAHFVQPNVVAFTRWTDREMPDGTGLLFIEEVQSDWHQQGRDNGYNTLTGEKLDVMKDTLSDLQAGFRKIRTNIAEKYNMSEHDVFQDALWSFFSATSFEEPGFVPDYPFMFDHSMYWRDKSEEFFDDMLELYKQNLAVNEARNILAVAESGDMVPDAPFKTSWHALAMKRMVRYAADHEYGEIGWTTGDQQNERWSLSKMVDRIDVAKAGSPIEGDEQMYHLDMYRYGSRIDLPDTNMVSEKRLGELIGKELAQRAIDQMNADDYAEARLEGLDLEVGGKGMRAFYDQKLVNFMNKFGKRYGVKVETKTIETAEGNEKIHTFQITEQMAEDALAGMPMFNQDQGGPKGSITFGETGVSINLFKAANLSTFAHESGHAFLEIFTQAAQRTDNDQMQKDLAILRGYLGNAGEAYSVEQHERFARSIEAYLREGNSPSIELRSVFQRFRAWLMLVYRKVAGLDVSLNDDVRGVMDRMFATDAQIQAAKAAVSMEPMFDNQEQAAMTDQEWAQYTAAADDASRQAITELEERKMRTVKAERKRAWKDQHKSVKQSLIDEMNRQPVYQALHYLMYGTAIAGEIPEGFKAMKLDKDATLAVMDDPADLKKLPGRGKTGIYRLEGGVDPDDVAALFGFASGRELIQAILAAGDKNKIAEQQATEYMRMVQGELGSEWEQAQAALEAIHNDKTALFLEAELRMINKRAGIPGTPAAQAQAMAKSIIGRKRVAEIRPGQFQQGQVRAARAAERAMVQDDWAEASRQKHAQLVNHYLYREALAANERVERMQKKLSTFMRPGTRKNLARDHLQQIDQILDQLDLQKSVTLKALAERKSILEYVNEKAAEGSEVHLDPATSQLLLKAEKIHYKDLSLDQFKGIFDTVRSIEHVARAEQRLLVDGQKREIEEVVKDMTDVVDQHHKRHEEPVDYATGPWQEFKKWGKSFLAAHKKLEFLFRQMDAEIINGPFWTHLFKPIADAENAEQVMQRQVIDRLKEIFSVYTPKERKSWNKKFEIPGMGTFTKESLLSLALNWGNEGNREAIINGNGWSRGQVERALDRLDKRDWEFVQNIWDLVDAFWPEISELQMELTGVVPEKIQATPLTFKWGTIRGGYYPLKYDANRDEKIFRHDEKAATEDLFESNFLKPATKTGHTKERLQNVKRPVDLSLSVLNTHLNNVIHDLTHRKAIMQVDRLSQHKEIQKMIIEVAGRAVYREIRPWLQSIARDQVESPHVTDTVFRRLRKNSTIVNMGWKVTTGLVQWTGYFQTLEVLGEGYALAGLKLYRNPAKTRQLVKEIMEKSVFMRNRMTTFDRDVRDTLRRITGDSVKDRLERTFFSHIGFMDMGVSLPTWLGGYLKALDEGMTEDDAVAYADSVVRQTQGAGGAKDLARIQRGTEMHRTLTMFYSYFSVLYNLMARRAGMTIREKDIFRAFTGFMYLIVLPSVLSELTLGRGPEDDEEWGDWMMKTIALYPMNAVVGLRDFSAGAFGDYGYTMTPVIDAISTLSRIPGESADIIEDEADLGTAKLSAYSMGYLFGLPVRQLWNSIDHAIDVTEGEDEFSLWEFLVRNDRDE